MKSEEFKIGVQFIYEGQDWCKEKGVLQTVIDVLNCIIYTDLTEFDEGSGYISDCVLVSTLLSSTQTEGYRIVEIQKVIK
jgi:hypothetical protein